MLDCLLAWIVAHYLVVLKIFFTPEDGIRFHIPKCREYFVQVISNGVEKLTYPSFEFIFIIYKGNPVFSCCTSIEPLGNNVC